MDFKADSKQNVLRWTWRSSKTFHWYFFWHISAWLKGSREVSHGFSLWITNFCCASINHMVNQGSLLIIRIKDLLKCGHWKCDNFLWNILKSSWITWIMKLFFYLSYYTDDIVKYVPIYLIYVLKLHFFLKIKYFFNILKINFVSRILGYSKSLSKQFIVILNEGFVTT